MGSFAWNQHPHHRLIPWLVAQVCEGTASCFKLEVGESDEKAPLHEIFPLVVLFLNTKVSKVRYFYQTKSTA